MKKLFRRVYETHIRMSEAFRIKAGATILGLIISAQIDAQDSTVVHQKYAAMFSNRYIFYSNNSFKHYFETDDLQTWYGIGNYKDAAGYRILKFGEADSSVKQEFGVVHYESNFKRKLKISGKKIKSKDYYHTVRRGHVVFEAK